MRTDQQWRTGIDPSDPSLPSSSIPLFAWVPLIRYDVSIKLQSKREEVKSVLCV